MSRQADRPVGQELAVVHPQTGEVLDLEHDGLERLGDVHILLKAAEQALRDMRTTLEGELRHRFAVVMDERGVVNPSSRHFVAVGNLELRIAGGNESEWDADELERVLRELIDEGALTAGDVTDVIRHETTVSRSNANRLLDRLGGSAYARVAACRTWRRKSGYVRVDRTTWPEHD